MKFSIRWVYTFTDHGFSVALLARTIKINYLTYTSLFLESMFGDRQLGIATGFVWEHQDSYFLVTNWHVITGLHPQTGQPLSESGATPDVLRIWIHTTENLE